MVLYHVAIHVLGLIIRHAKDIILAGLAHGRDRIFLSGNIITEGSCFDAFSIIAGDTDTLFDAGLTVLAVEDDLREEIEFPVDSVRLEARYDLIFHEPIISYLGGYIKNKMLEDLFPKCLWFPRLRSLAAPPNRPIAARFGGLFANWRQLLAYLHASRGQRVSEFAMLLTPLHIYQTEIMHTREDKLELNIHGAIS